MYRRKTVSFEKEDFEQFTVYINQVLETADILKERREKGLNLSDYLTALEIHTKVLKDYKKELYTRYDLGYILTAEKIFWE